MASTAPAPGVRGEMHRNTGGDAQRHTTNIQKSPSKTSKTPTPLEKSLDKPRPIPYLGDMSKWTQNDTKRALELFAWTAAPFILAILGQLLAP